jgi:hypothetical protein
MSAQFFIKRFWPVLTILIWIWVFSHLAITCDLVFMLHRKQSLSTSIFLLQVGQEWQWLGSIGQYNYKPRASYQHIGQLSMDNSTKSVTWKQLSRHLSMPHQWVLFMGLINTIVLWGHHQRLFWVPNSSDWHSMANIGSANSQITVKKGILRSQEKWSEYFLLLRLYQQIRKKTQIYWLTFKEIHKEHI